MNISVKRRLFLSSGIGALSAAKSSDKASAENIESRFDPDTVRIGIVGCGPYSHGQSYGEVLLATDGRRPNKTHMRITHVWGDDYRNVFKGSIRTSGKARRWLDTRSPEYFVKNDPEITIVKKPGDMIGDVDAVMIMDFDNSANLAAPFLQNGLPIFVNRPYAPTMKDGRRILAMAKKSGSAVITGSLVSTLFATQKCKASIDRKSLYAYFADVLSASFSRYISHGLEFVYAIVGPKVRRVRLSGWDGSYGYDPAQTPPISIELEYEPDKSGKILRGTVLARGKYPHVWWFRGYHHDGTLVEGTVKDHDGVPPDVMDDHWRVPFLGLIEKTFRTGKSPETHEDILHKLATLIAVHKSAMEEGRWVRLDEVGNHRLPTVIIQSWDEKVD